MQLNAQINNQISIKYNLDEFVSFYRDAIVNRSLMQIKYNNDQSGLQF